MFNVLIIRHYTITPPGDFTDVKTVKRIPVENLRVGAFAPDQPRADV